MRIMHARQITIFDNYELTLAVSTGASVLFVPGLRHSTLSHSPVHWLGAIVGFVIAWVWTQFATGSLFKWRHSRGGTGGWIFWLAYLIITVGISAYCTVVLRALFRFLKL